MQRHQYSSRGPGNLSAWKLSHLAGHATECIQVPVHGRIGWLLVPDCSVVDEEEINRPRRFLWAENLGCREIVKVWGRCCKVGASRLASCSCGLKLSVWVWTSHSKPQQPFKVQDDKDTHTNLPTVEQTDVASLLFPFLQHLLSSERAFSTAHSTLPTKFPARNSHLKSQSPRCWV